MCCVLREFECLAKFMNSTLLRSQSRANEILLLPMPVLDTTNTVWLWIYENSIRNLFTCVLYIFESINDLGIGYLFRTTVGATAPNL